MPRASAKSKKSSHNNNSERSANEVKLVSSQNLKPGSGAAKSAKRESRSNASEGLKESRTLKAETNNANLLADHFQSAMQEDKKVKETPAFSSDKFQSAQKEIQKQIE